MDEEQQKAELKARYQADQKARGELTAKTLEVTEKSQPTPTQEENDLLKLGLMHPDDKANPDNPEMPPLGMQQEMLARAQTATGPTPRPAAQPPAAGTGHPAAHEPPAHPPATTHTPPTPNSKR